MGMINNKWFQAFIVLVIANFFTPLGDSAVGAIGFIGMLIVFVPKLREMAKLDKIVNIKESPKKTKSNDSISEDIHAENLTEQTSAEETAKNKTVKDLIMESLEGALKEFILDPPREAYSSGDGYFSWYINIRDSEGNQLSEKTGDDFCVNCDVGLLEDVVMNDSIDFTEVEADVRQCFKDYLYQSQETILIESADKVDVSKSYFEVAVFEVVDDGADVWKYYRVNHYFKSD